MIPSWEGDERRAIQTHVLNWVEERLTTHVDKVEKLFDNHTREEMERYQEILEMIAQNTRLIEMNAAASEKRHADICRSIDSYMDKSEKVYDALKAAFVKDPKGDPDFYGHARAHESWIEERREWKEMATYVKRTVLSAATIALCSWIGVLIWQGALKGPAG